MKKLENKQVIEKLKEISGWQTDSALKKIEKNFLFSNFTDTVCFLNRIAEMAEEMNHHPDLHLTDYKHLKVVLSTHSAGGLTQHDFKLAFQIEEVAREAQTHFGD